MPGALPDRQLAALQSGAVDLGPVGPDNTYGSGRLDALASYNWLRSTPDFSVAVAPSSASTQPGGTVTYTVTVTGSGGFAGDVSLALSGLPAGGTFDPAVVSGGSGTSLLTVVGPTTPGTSSLTITGTSGTTSRAGSASLTVLPPPDYGVAATPTARTVNAGATATYSISVSPANGFTGDVTLGTSGLPASVGTAVVSPAVVHGSGTAQLSIATSTTAPGGTYPVTVTGVSGTLSHAVTVSLTVNPRDFGATITPSSVTVTRTQTATYTVKVTSINGFTGSVALKVTGLPANSSATWTGNPVNAPGSATLKVKTTSTTTRGTYTLKVTATSGALSHPATATLVVR
jgi:hypothetical protein